VSNTPPSKLSAVIGLEYAIEVEIKTDDSRDLVLTAEVESLRSLDFRSPEGAIIVVLLLPCLYRSRQC
jgi:hypothetical protein